MFLHEPLSEYKLKVKATQESLMQNTMCHNVHNFYDSDGL